MPKKIIFKPQSVGIIPKHYFIKTNCIMVLLIIFLAFCSIANAQYTKLLDFNNSNGNSPFGSVILSDNDSVLYGMTSSGGPTNGGIIFSIKTDGTGYTNLHTFIQGVTTEGSYPLGSLIRSGNVLYGMTSSGGTNSNGTIFSINTDGSTYTILYNFFDSVGNTISGNPWSTLTLSGNVLYGTTYGAPGNGNVFSIHTDGSVYTDLLDFNMANGQHPGYGALAFNVNVLYGTTMYGGSNGIGTIFSIHTNGTGYHKLLDFNTANGGMPYGSVVLSGNMLFGATAAGGAYDHGVIYSIHTDGTSYKKLFDFDNTNGISPDGTLTLSDNLLYGTTSGGGVNQTGTIFSIDTSGTGFQSLYSFNTPTGTQPRAQLTLSGNILYGTGVIGGAFDDGVVFSFKTKPAAIPICMVTVDDSSKYNHIVWDKPLVNNIDSFIIYREITSNVYKPLGAVPYAAISEFVDTVRTKYFPFTGNPNSGTFRYKLQYRDINGNYSAFSPYHNTLFVTQSGGTFNWNQYTIEGDSAPLPALTAYVLYRDDNNTGAWHAVQGVSGTQTTITDPDFSSFPNGRWRVETTWNISCSSSKSSYSTSKSNVKTATTGIETFLNSENVKIFPNPANDIITISIPQQATIEITNIQGQIIKTLNITNQETTIDVSGLSGGVYIIKVMSDKRVVVRKLIKQ